MAAQLQSLAHSGILVPALGYPDQVHRNWYYNPHDIKKYRETYVTSDIAAAIVGCARSSLHKWTKLGYIKAASGPGIDGGAKWRYDRYALLQWRKERLKSNEVMDLLGISRQAVHRLVAKDCLTPLSNMPRYPSWFARKDVERLKKSIQATPKKPIPRKLYNVTISKRRFRLTDLQAEQLLEEYNKCSFEPTRIRQLAVWLYGLGHSCGEIMELTGCSRGGLWKWCYKYKQKGIEGLRDKRRRVKAKAN
jgi:biotin operon repressor